MDTSQALVSGRFGPPEPGVRHPDRESGCVAAALDLAETWTPRGVWDGPMAPAPHPKVPMAPPAVHRAAGSAGAPSAPRPSVATMRRALPLVATLTALALTPSCGGSSTPPSASSTGPVTVLVPTATTASTTTTAAITPAPFDVIANMPAAAKEHTDRGAEAFARYFFEAASRTMETPSPGEIPRLCVPDLSTCTKRDARAKELLAKGHRVSGPEIRVKTVLVIPDTPLPETYRYVTVALQQLASRRLDSQGRDLGEWTNDSALVVETKQIWKDSGWLMLELGKVTSGSRQ